MTWSRQIRRGWRVLTRRAAADAELNDELRHYYDASVAELVARGVAPAEARRQVRLQLGEPANIVEEVRAHGWERLVDAVVVDLRHAIRRLRRSPGFVVVTVLTLGVGMGASTAIFSAVRPILLEPLPYDGADRLVTISDVARDGSPLDVAFGTVREIAQRSRSYEALAALRLWQPTLTGAGQPERLNGQRVGAQYFRALAVRPALGRDFTEADDVVRGPNVVLLSHGLWQRDFAGDEAIIGRAITLNDEPFTVIGVLPADFENVLAPAAEVYAPLQYDAALPPDGREWGHHLRLIGRLAPAVRLETAVSELATIARTPLPQFIRMPWASLDRGLAVSELRAEVTRAVRPALLAVMGAVLLLLVIACVNVANLSLARSAQRSGELALRAALGAGRRRLLAQILVESLLLALLGAAAGLGVARLGVRALIALSPPDLPRLHGIGIDAGVFAFALGLATVIGIAVGLFVALNTGRHHAVALQRGSQRIHGGQQRTRRILVVAQVALAVVLLVSGGLLLHSLQRLFAVDPGFDARQLLTLQVQTSGRRFADAAVTHNFFASALDAVRALPGVRAAAYTSQLPLSGELQKYGVHLESAEVIRPDEDGSAFRYAVTPDYFRTMGIRLRRGRLLEESDHGGAAAVVVISAALAERRLAGSDPIGQRIRLGGDEQPYATIVGIVDDVHQVSLGLAQENAIYLPTTQGHFVDRTLWLVVRTEADPSTYVRAVQNAIWSVAADQPITRVATMAELVQRSAAERRFTLVIFDAFALAALLLAAVGLYGVLGAMVNARVREIGVRAALGATRGDILRLIVGQGVALTGLGLGIGLALALAATRAIRSLLYGVSALDPVTYGGVLALMFAVCLAACWLPARRGIRVQPSIALRAE